MGRLRFNLGLGETQYQSGHGFIGHRTKTTSLIERRRGGRTACPEAIAKNSAIPSSVHMVES